MVLPWRPEHGKVVRMFSRVSLPDGRDFPGDTRSLLQAVHTAMAMNRDGNHGTPVDVYTGENVSNIVVKIIQSYVTVVNKMVWRKE